MIGGFGATELLIILAIFVLVFGASRLPKLGKGLGEGLRGFKDGLKEGVTADKSLADSDGQEEAPADSASEAKEA